MIFSCSNPQTVYLFYLVYGACTNLFRIAVTHGYKADPADDFFALAMDYFLFYTRARPIIYLTNDYIN